MKTPVIVALLCVAVAATLWRTYRTQTPHADFDALIANHRWFELRAAVAAGGAPIYARGVSEFAFNRVDAAEADLLAALASAPEGPVASQVHARLFQLYLRQGRYRSALDQIDASLRANPTAADRLNARALLAPLAASADLSVEPRQSATFPVRFLDGNLVLPVEIDGHPGHYVFDCGANVSVLSASEAVRAGLRVLDGEGALVGMTGTTAPVRIAVAETLRIGGVTMHHVAFTVNPDTLPPFDDWPKDVGGILGIQTAMALGSVQWSPAGRVTVATDLFAPSAAPPNMALDDNWPVVQVRFRGTTLAVAFDTGAQQTVLYPPFAAAFPDLIRQGTQGTQPLSGFSGTTEVASISLPSLTFEVGDRPVVLAPAEVLLRQTLGMSRWYAGNFGMDLLNQAQTVDLDFRAMRFALK
jgi:hypothetical protein